MWIGPVQFNRPSKALSSMDVVDKTLAVWYGVMFLLFLFAAYSSRGAVSAALSAEAILALLLFFNRLGLWCL